VHMHHTNHTLPTHCAAPNGTNSPAAPTLQKWTTMLEEGVHIPGDAWNVYPLLLPLIVRVCQYVASPRMHLKSHTSNAR
jgi:hypothetical protein